MLRDLWDLNPLSRDRTPVSWVARRVLTQWTPREAPRYFSCSPSFLSSAPPYLSWGTHGPHSPDQRGAYFLLRTPDNWMVHWLYSCSGFLVPSRTHDLRNVWLGGQEIGGSAESVCLGRVCPGDTTPGLTGPGLGTAVKITERKTPTLSNTSLVPRQAGVQIVSKGSRACKVNSCQQSYN